jgi:hypothetical protein
MHGTGPERRREVFESLKRAVEGLFAWTGGVRRSETDEQGRTSGREQARGNARRTERPDCRRRTAELVPWWETPEGRERLTAEQRALDMMGMRHSTFLLADGTPGFALPRGAGRELAVVLGQGFPVTAPTVLARWERADDTRESAVVKLPSRWSTDARVVDVVLPLVEPAWWCEAERRMREGH